MILTEDGESYLVHGDTNHNECKTYQGIFVYFVMDKFEEFKKKINSKLHVMEAKIEFMHKSTGELGKAMKEFQEEFDLFIEFTSDLYQDHEKRISSLEKKVS